MDLYDDLRHYLKAGGLSEADINAYVLESRREDEHLDRCECPKCGARVVRKLDDRQAGVSQIAGKWFSYRCVSCPYWIDRKEPVGEN